MSDEDLAKLIEACEEMGYGAMLSEIADRMSYSAELGAIVIPVENTPDEVFPDDRDLDNGPLTLSVWRQALHVLADRLPPWEEDAPPRLRTVGWGPIRMPGEKRWLAEAAREVRAEAEARAVDRGEPI